MLTGGSEANTHPFKLFTALSSKEKKSVYRQSLVYICMVLLSRERQNLEIHLEMDCILIHQSSVKWI